MLKRIGKNWKDTRNHLFHMCYKQIRTYEKNLKHHPAGIDKNDWKKFVDYRLNEETQKKCKQNALNRSKQLYTHTGGSKILAREKDEVEREQGRPVGRGELFIMTHKKKMARISIPMRVLLVKQLRMLRGRMDPLNTFHKMTRYHRFSERSTQDEFVL
ncbi:uncharacterized protein [Arachis hypogaea]|uniref:uncharacterized protein n=1 Tax=Arachis hypogaea TaxID=3818 RepID=UPI003B2168C0